MLCIICLETLILRDDVFTARCGHCLHYRCWRRCIRTNQSCPVCRKVTTFQHLIRLYFNGEADDVIEPYTRHIASLTSKVTSLDDQVKAAEKRIANEQTANALLREQLEQCEKRRDQAILLWVRHVKDFKCAEREVQSLYIMLDMLVLKSEQQLEAMKEKLESALGETSFLQQRLLAIQEKLQSAVASSLSNKQQRNHLEKINDNEIVQVKEQFDNLRENLKDTMHKSEVMQQQLDANGRLAKKMQSKPTRERSEYAIGLIEAHTGNVLQGNLVKAKKPFQALFRESYGNSAIGLTEARKPFQDLFSREFYANNSAIGLTAAKSKNLVEAKKPLQGLSCREFYGCNSAIGLTEPKSKNLVEAKKPFQGLFRENGQKIQREVLFDCQEIVVKLESQILPPSQRAGAVERSASINAHTLEKGYQELCKNFQILKKRLGPCAIP